MYNLPVYMIMFTCLPVSLVAAGVVQVLCLPVIYMHLNLPGLSTCVILLFVTSLYVDKETLLFFIYIVYLTYIKRISVR